MPMAQTQHGPKDALPLLKEYLDFVIMKKFCMDLKLDFNYKGMIMKIDCFFMLLMLLVLRINLFLMK